MSKTQPPELKRFMDKHLRLKLNGGRHLLGILRGFDPFMNLVLDDVVQVFKNGDTIKLGMIVVRGNSMILLEAIEKVN